MSLSIAKWITAILAAVALILFGLVTFVMEGHSVSSQALSQFQVGMPKQQVKETFGNPTSIKLDELLRVERWRYSGMTWCMVDIQFDQNGAATEIIHDH